MMNKMKVKKKKERRKDTDLLDQLFRTHAQRDSLHRTHSPCSLSTFFSKQLFEEEEEEEERKDEGDEE